MRNHLPRLSIGLPVYNGDKFLKEAIDSLLNQTFEDFELIISDNASTDKTEEICRAYAAQDQRIRYYRNKTNIGCACNFNQVFELSSCEYFKWAAYDDLHAVNFLSKCIEVLDQNPTIILCHSQVYFIDEHGRFLQNYDIKLKTDSPKPQERFHELLTKHFCYQCYGVVRASALRMTPPMGSYGAADAIFLLRLGLFGRFYEIPEYLFFARSHSQQSLSLFFPDYLSFCTQNNSQKSLSYLPDFYGYAVWFDSANQGKMLFPHWRIFWEFLRSIWIVDLTIYQRLSCHISILIKLKGTEHLLLKDLLKSLSVIWQIWRLSFISKQPIYGESD
ncbi:MAG: glycosyltransferase family 2 protein [Gloeotrichia echinulata DEX184]|nr:glycosyltransferase [Gloeotrichia echinulata DEX184]